MPAKIAASHTEKKEKKSHHGGKGGKGHVKVIKRNLIIHQTSQLNQSQVEKEVNLIQSSELISREMPATSSGIQGANGNAGAGDGSTSLAATSVGGNATGAKRGSNAARTNSNMAAAPRGGCSKR